MRPGHGRVCGGRQCDLVVGAVDFDDDDSARSGRKFGEPAADGGQGGFVADQQMPVEVVGMMKEPRGPPSVSVSPGLACAAQRVAGPASWMAKSISSVSRPGRGGAA